MEEQVIFFESLNDAERFIKAHNLKFFRCRTSKSLKNGIELIIEKTFVCEICGETAPIRCEGSEPNTCAVCMPLFEAENMG